MTYCSAIYYVEGRHLPRFLVELQRSKGETWRMFIYTTEHIRKSYFSNTHRILVNYPILWRLCLCEDAV